ncbi:MBL fold metallo-hydrolase [Bacillus paralicheniformis]|uniref:MBL fold metallo-hydrolase n=1 Tax=Bacillus paralicheniformis TaxID=1648923 RepID=UPI001F35BBB2|nr:MBL fold metallo-hydrolase [Bacillus paralicheniformis]
MLAIEYSDLDQTYVVYQFKVRHANIINYNYIIVDLQSGRSAIVDPAWNMGLITSIFREIGTEPDIVLLTHSHYDHVNLVDEFTECYDVKVYMSRMEISNYGFASQNLIPVEDEDIIHLGGTSITCLLTPGHTAGGMSFLLKGSMFTGDTVFIEGCGVCDMPGGSPEQMFSSIQKIKRLVSPSVRIFPGHSFGKEPGYPISYLLENNMYFLIDEQSHFVNFRMRKNQKHVFDFK